jgi:hypothetical protein
MFLIDKPGLQHVLLPLKENRVRKNDDSVARESLTNIKFPILKERIQVAHPPATLKDDNIIGFDDFLQYVDRGEVENVPYPEIRVMSIEPFDDSVMLQLVTQVPERLNIFLEMTQ